jgi:hypothetical protein
MNGERPPGPGDRERAAQLRDLDDEQLIAALREVLMAVDPPPRRCMDLAKDSFALRMVDAELATLVDDARLALTRAGAPPKLTVFDANGLGVEIEVIPGSRPRSWQVIGQLFPPAAARIRIRRQPDEAPEVTADDLGRFMIDQLPAGPLSLAIEVDGRPPVVTDWIAVG